MSKKRDIVMSRKSEPVVYEYERKENGKIGSDRKRKRQMNYEIDNQEDKEYEKHTDI